MKRFAKILGWTLGVLVLLIGVAIGGGYLYLTSTDFRSIVENEASSFSGRKTKIENLVQALQPFFAEGQVPATSAQQQPGDVQPELAAQEGTEAPEGYSFRDVPNPLPDVSEAGGDPFQRRVKATFRFKGLATQRAV